jgi:hypothetical protein
MKARSLAWSLAWMSGIGLAACSAGEVPAPSAIGSAGAASVRIGEAAVAPAAPVSAPMSTAGAGSPGTLAQDDTPPLPTDDDPLAGPVLPPEVVSMMTYEQYRLTLDPPGPDLSAFATGSGSDVDLVLGSTSVVDDPTPPADMDVE